MIYCKSILTTIYFTWNNKYGNGWQEIPMSWVLFKYIILPAIKIPQIKEISGMANK